MVKLAAVQFGFDDVRRNLIRMGGATTDMSDPLEQIVDDITEIEEKIFSSEGRRGGGMWQRPVPAWRARKIKAGKGDKTLVYSKRLRRSVTYTGNPEMIKRIDGKRGVLVFGTRVPYGLLHQKGVTHEGRGLGFRGGEMPQRKFIYFVKGDRVKFAKRVNKHIIGVWKLHAKKRKSTDRGQPS